MTSEFDDIRGKNTHYDARIGNLESESKNSLAELISIREANFANEEQVRFVSRGLEARVDSLDEERRKTIYAYTYVCFFNLHRVN